MAELIKDKQTLLDNIRLYRPYILFVIAVIILFAYIFTIVFGDKSIVVLLELRKQEKDLQNSVVFYQKQNAYLQKEIFELSGE